MTPDGASVYVPNALSSSVSVISTATNAVVATVVVSTHPRSVIIKPKVRLKTRRHEVLVT